MTIATINIEALERAARGSPPAGPAPTPSSQTTTPASNTTKKPPKRKNNKRKRGQGQQTETNTTNNETTNPVGAATAKGPISIVTQTMSKKHKKSLQTEEEDEQYPQCPTAVEELMKLSFIKLWKIAQDYSKQSMSDKDEEFFLALHQEQEKEQAIKAIERGVSLSMVFAIL
jgi:Tfp pilus assembly major pilin PilA